MEEKVVNFETAKLVKEKGFSGFCNGYYYKDTGECEGLYCYYSEGLMEIDYSDSLCCQAPTQSLLQKWLRDNRDMWVTVLFDGITYRVSIWGRYTPTDDEIIISPFEDPDNWLTTYEQALEEGLKKALTLLN